MNDLHMHVLWGLDDGSRSAQETLNMLRESARQGVRRIAATTHAYPGIQRFDMDAYERRLEEARAICRQHDLAIELLPGAEIAATYQTALALRNRTVPTLGNGDYALIELWHSISWPKVYDVVDSVLRTGVIPILAHVERYSCFLWEPKRALRLRQETGALFQMNAATLLGRPGLLYRRFIKRMLSEEGIDAVASDAHNMRLRAPNLGSARQRLVEIVGEEYARRLTNFEVIET